MHSSSQSGCLVQTSGLLLWCSVPSLFARGCWFLGQICSSVPSLGYREGSQEGKEQQGHSCASGLLLASPGLISRASASLSCSTFQAPGPWISSAVLVRGSTYRPRRAGLSHLPSVKDLLCSLGASCFVFIWGSMPIAQTCKRSTLCTRMVGSRGVQIINSTSQLFQVWLRRFIDVSVFWQRHFWLLGLSALDLYLIHYLTAGSPQMTRFSRISSGVQLWWWPKPLTRPFLGPLGSPPSSLRAHEGMFLEAPHS